MYFYLCNLIQFFLKWTKSSKQAIQSQRKLAEESLKGFETD